MSVEIFTPTYNGMRILPLFIEHYRERFPNCRINIMDDGSTDGTQEYCESKGCIVTTVSYENNNKEEGHEPRGMAALRNSCWKNSEAEWIIVVDQDELADVWEKDLELLKDFDIVKFKGYDIYGLGETDPKKMFYGRLHKQYCKPIMFRKSIGEINFTLGSHHAYPPEGTRWARNYFNLYHYANRNMSIENFIRYFERVLPIDVIENHYAEITHPSKIRKVKNI